MAQQLNSNLDDVKFHRSHSCATQASSVKETCRRLGGISRSTFYRLVEKGELHVRKLGNRTVVLESEIERYLNSLPYSRQS